MSWAEIKKAVNSDLTTPLNSKIDAQTTTLANKFGLKFKSRTAINTTQSSTPVAFTTDESGFVCLHAGESNNDQLRFANSDAMNWTQLTDTIARVVYSTYGSSYALVPVEKGHTYYLMGLGTITYFALGGVFNYLLSLITSTDLEKGGVLV